MGLYLIALAGVIGTTAMIGVMSFVHRMKWANADMVRAIGSIFSKSSEMTLFYGLMTHYCFGLFFAFLYAILIATAPVLTPGTAVIISTLTGLVHGLMVGLLLSVVVAEYHPVAKFRDAGLTVAAAHVVGHIFYGLCLGLSFAASWSGIHTSLEDFATGKGLGDILGFAIIWLPLFGVPSAFVAYIVYSFSTPHRVSERSRVSSRRRTQKVKAKKAA